MKFSDNRWTHVFVASGKDFVRMENLRKKIAAEDGVSIFQKEAGGARAFVASNTRPDETGKIFLWWKKERLAESPEFSYLKVRIADGEAFEIESDPFGWHPFYAYWNDELFFASNWLWNVVDAMRILGIPVDSDPEACYFSIGAHFIPNGLSAIRGIQSFPYGTRAVFPVSESGTVRFEKISKPLFRPSSKPMSEVVSEYRRNVDRVTDEIASEWWKIGVLFTGWLDSSAILTLLHKKGLWDRSVAITVLNPDFPSKDDENAKKIAEDLGIEHRIVRIENQDAFRLPEEIWYAEDPTDVYGYGISLLKAMDSCGDVRTFVNGAWTDAAIGSTPALVSAVWNAFYHPDDPVKWWVVGKFFDSLTTADGQDVMALMKSSGFDVSAWIEKLSRLSLVEPWLIGLTRNDYLPGSEWGNGKYVRAYRDPYGMDSSKLRFHDFLTLLDYDGLAHRFSDLYKKTAAAKGVAMFSPLGCHSVRQVLFDAPVEYKFNPACYQTGVRDNQLFYKKALWDLIPERIRHRQKRNGSVPDIRSYLTAESTKGTMKAVYRKFGKRRLVSDSMFLKIEKLWDYADGKWNAGSESMSNEDVVLYANLSLVWRIVVLEVFFQLFVDGKGFEKEPPSLDLRDYA